jgi:hypothetical protein
MQRKPNIRWKQGDVERLEREIRRFNSKLKRVKKRNPELENILPNPIKKKDFKESITTRQDLNRELNSLSRFSKSGAEKPITSKTGNTVTVWEKKEVGLKVAQINRERTKERKKVEAMETTSRGKETGLKRGEMGSERLSSLQPKSYNFDKIRGGKEWEKFKSSVNKQATERYKQEQMNNYKMNYLKAISRVFGDYGEDLARKIKQLPSEVVVDLFYSEQEATIDFVYDPRDLVQRLEVVESIWQSEYDKNPNIEYNENWSADQETELSEWIEKGW